jgi:hypothetical protein
MCWIVPYCQTRNYQFANLFMQKGLSTVSLYSTFWAAPSGVYFPKFYSSKATLQEIHTFKETNLSLMILCSV